MLHDVNAHRHVHSKFCFAVHAPKHHVGFCIGPTYAGWFLPGSQSAPSSGMQETAHSVASRHDYHDYYDVPVLLQLVSLLPASVHLPCCTLQAPVCCVLERLLSLLGSHSTWLARALSTTPRTTLDSRPSSRLSSSRHHGFQAMLHGRGRGSIRLSNPPKCSCQRTDACYPASSPREDELTTQPIHQCSF